MTVESEMDKAENNVSSKKTGRSRQGAVQRARENVLARFGITEGPEARRQFADPAAMM